jgi:site-specific recombinase XerD
MEKATIQELSSAVLSELKRLGYADATVEAYDRMYRKLTRYAMENGIQYYSIDVSERWLKESLGIDPGLVVRTKNGRYKTNSYYAIRACQCLTEWQIHGCIALKKQGKLASLEIPHQFKEGFESYTSFCREAEYSERGTYTRLNRIKRMLLFFEQHGISNFNNITGKAISAFFGTQIELDSRTVATMLSSCRVFFRHLYRMGFTQDNLIEKLPNVKANRQFKLPKAWRKEDVLTVLESIDRGSPVGKRDYAILMLITRYGLRSVDVKTMKLSDIRWKEKVIEIVQNKTRNVLRLPLLHDVGWALIDYLKHGRPPSDHSEIFLTCTVPIRPFGIHSCGLNAILAKRVQQAGVRIPRDVPKGMHSLRHTLASVMLANDTELPVISSVLGHVTSESTGIYLHVDILRLRECVLDPEEVLSNGEK